MKNPKQSISKPFFMKEGFKLPKTVRTQMSLKWEMDKQTIA